MIIRHEINMVNFFYKNSFAAHPASMVYIDPSKYSGSITSYFEIVCISNGVDYNLRDSSGNIHATIDTASSASILRYRVAVSTTLTADSYYCDNENSNNFTYAARIIIIQDTSTDPITDSESQFEIGDYEYEIFSTTQTPLAYPKYWNYNSSNWDGTLTFYVEVVWSVLSDKYAGYVYLEEDDGSFGNWTTKETIVDAGTSVIATRTRVQIDPAPTSGRNYRLAFKTAETKASYGMNIYNAKIIVQQTSETAITKLEEHYLLLNSGTVLEGQLLNCDGYYDADEWDGVTVNLYPEHDASGATCNTKLQEDTDGTPSDVSNSSITGANRTRGGTALSITDNEDIDTYVVEAG